tara:strand:+ start:16675 stop:16893 length:219 start_codon:yes stop_codon:yes gene_type:complete
MKTLDLHGERHSDIARKVANFILLNKPPLKIVTGKSQRMIAIVTQILDKYDFDYYPEYFINYGAYIVQEKRR